MQKPSANDGHPDAVTPPTSTGQTGDQRPPFSARQLAANRRNAQKSTGPTSAAGKERVSRNAIKHGNYADIRPIDHGAFREDPLAVQVTVDGVLSDLQPRDAMERASAVRVANLELQLGRFHEFATVDVELMSSAGESNLAGHHHGGSLEEASRWCAEFARTEAERLPDSAAELKRASQGTRHMVKTGTLDAHTASWLG